MWYCCVPAIYTGASSNVVFGVYMIKLRHEKMLILRCTPSPSPGKFELPPGKKFPPPHTLKNIEHPDKNLKSLRIY